MLVTLFAALSLAADPQLQKSFENAVEGFPGRIGVCAQSGTKPVCLNSGQRFSMQSVMKTIVGIAALEQVDKGRWKLDDQILIHRKDLSLYVQPIEKLVGPNGWQTTLGDLIRRATVDSDSAAVDILITRLGGTAKVQDFLNRKHLKGIRLDRDERHLQTEIAGITWREEFVEPPVLDAALKAIPTDVRTAAYTRYKTDPRDTSTPEGMAQLLLALAQGKLLAPATTTFMLDVLEQTVTFPDRLKAGVQPGWTLGHKTGSSGSWQGLTIATNDVGILRGPNNATIAIVVFIADSTAPNDAKAKLMATLCRLTIEHYQR